MAKKKTEPGKTDAARQGPPKQAPVMAVPYLVLARKYRPTTFGDLIGQEAMVRTLTNAFATDRIAQGYMLTGVRGVGKTTTARILSRALNYQTDTIAKPTLDMPVFGRHCAEIMEGRHPDVLEMDAASNTGVDNIRELIESARYKPLVARYKVYLIDEVHMLSKGAFNALLKTLEEPPDHVKFIFATTEVRKVPVTVLSRTQRFDLRRVAVPMLVAHFSKIVASEGASAEEEALALIARAAEGSVRDGLSLLDQALAMGTGKVDATGVRAMLGLADRGRILDLLEQLMAGAAGEALEAYAKLYADGGEPAQILADLAEAAHICTRAKMLGASAAGAGLSGEEKARAAGLGERLSLAILARAWQMLLKGLEEVARAPDASAAAEMVLIRLAYTADLPTPDEVIRVVGGVGKIPARITAPERDGRPATASKLDTPLPGLAQTEESDGAGEELDEGADYAPGPMLGSFADVVAFAGAQREAKLKVHLEEHVSLVKFDAAGSIELHLLAGAPKELANELREKLNAWTGRRWIIAISKTPGAPAMGQVQRERDAAELSDIKRHPSVAAVLQQFPDAVVTLKELPGVKTDDTGTG
jgi:DNA polymerase III subunit gamma/tau